MLEQLGQQTGGQFGDIFGAQQVGDAGQLQGAQAQAIQALLSGLGGVAGPSQQAFQQGLQTGFAPEILGDIEAKLLPALERSFDRSALGLREQASGLGALRGTGTVQGLADLRGGLESGLLSNLAGIQGQLGLGGQQVRAGLAGQGVQLPQQVLAALSPATGQFQQGQQFQAGQPLNALGTVTSGASATPMFQPTFGPSKFEQLAGGAAAVGSFL